MNVDGPNSSPVDGPTVPDDSEVEPVRDIGPLPYPQLRDGQVSDHLGPRREPSIYDNLSLTEIREIEDHFYGLKGIREVDLRDTRQELIQSAEQLKEATHELLVANRQQISKAQNPRTRQEALKERVQLLKDLEQAESVLFEGATRDYNAWNERLYKLEEEGLDESEA